MSPREHWSSDSAEAVDLLVASCQRPRASLEVPSQPHLIGRELTPYFGSSEPETFPAPAEAPSSGHKASKRKSASPSHAASGRPRSAHSPSVGKKPDTRKATTTSNAGSSSSEDEAATKPHHQRKSAKAAASSPVAAAKQPRHPSPPASFPAHSPSCPGQFRASPKPDALPVPSSSLLLRALSHHATLSRVAVTA